jgi:Protein of unknown function (DUF998)
LTRAAAHTGTAEIRQSTSRRERALLACGVIGPPLFVAVSLVESLVHPAGYRPLRHTVRAFVLGEFGWVQRASCLLTGGLLLAFAVGLRPALRRYRAGRWVPVLVGLFAIGLVGSGVFAADPSASGVTAAAPYPLGTWSAPLDSCRGPGVRGRHDRRGVRVTDAGPGPDTTDLTGSF